MKVSDLIGYLRQLEPWVEVKTEHDRPLMLTFDKGGIMIGEVCAECEELPCMCKFIADLERNAQKR